MTRAQRAAPAALHFVGKPEPGRVLERLLERHEGHMSHALLLGSFARGAPAMGWSDLDLVCLTESARLPDDIHLSFDLGPGVPVMTGSVRWGQWTASRPLSLLSNRDKIIAAVLGLPTNSKLLWGSVLEVNLPRSCQRAFYARAFVRLLDLASGRAHDSAQFLAKGKLAQIKAVVNLLRLECLLSGYTGLLDHQSMLERYRYEAADSVRAVFLARLLRARADDSARVGKLGGLARHLFADLGACA